jgi:hypothetical protein
METRVEWSTDLEQWHEASLAPGYVMQVEENGWDRDVVTVAMSAAAYPRLALRLRVLPRR